MSDEDLRAEAEQLQSLMIVDRNDTYYNRRLRAQIVELFAKYHGWVIGRKHFGRIALGQRSYTKGQKRARGYAIDGLPACCDHTYYFIENRKPIAIATFPYSVELDDMSKCAAAYGLDYHNYKGKWPDWWNPGHTEFYLWVPKGWPFLEGV